MIMSVSELYIMVESCKYTILKLAGICSLMRYPKIWRGRCNYDITPIMIELKLGDPFPSSI
jgi:hypothetical protein